MNGNEEDYGSLILGRFRQIKPVKSQDKCLKYLLKDVFGGERGEIKVQKQGQTKPTVLHQAGFLQQMQGYPGFPLMIWSGNHNNTEMGLITSKLGPSLTQLLPLGKNYFSLSTVCLIGQQIIKLLEILHDKHAVLSNFSPQNFKVNPKAMDKIMVGSLFYCKRYRSSRTLKHFKIKQADYGQFINHFVSLNRLVNMTTSRRDDLESFFFLLVFLIKGKLPWSHVSLKKVNKAQELMFALMEPLYVEEKSKVKEQLLEGLPRQFEPIFEHICQLQFDERPDYCFIRMKLKKMLAKLSKQTEPIMQWIPRLSNLQFKGLSPPQIDLYNEKDTKAFNQYYLPSQQKIQLDKIDSFSNIPHYKSNGQSKKKNRRRGTCQIM